MSRRPTDASLLDAAKVRINALQAELDETHRGVMALSCELEMELEQLRESESNYRQMVEDAIHGICRCLEDGTIVEANPAMVSFLGFESKQALVEVIRPEELFFREADRDELLAVLSRTGQVQGLEVHWRRADGTRAFGHVSGRRISRRDISGCYELVVEDLTQRRALEEQLRQSQKMQAVGQLAGGVAHDFNNLLTSILGSTEVLRDELPPKSPLLAELEEIWRAGNRAAELTRQLLTFGRRDIGAPTLISPNHVIQGLDSMLQRLIGEDVRLTTHLAPNVGAVHVDRSQLEQVVMNLVLNAREAMPAGGEIRVETSIAETPPELLSSPAAGKPWVLISISDDGQGMSEETLPRIFEPFFTTKERGTGLGLSLVYGIVERLGGRTLVESTEGVGSCFRIYLPRSEDPPSAEAAAQDSRNLAGCERILLVEDEESVRRLLARMLERYGYHVFEAEDPDEALRIWEREELDLLLTDIRLPIRSGVSLAKELLARGPSLRVLLISGYSDEHHFDEPHESNRLAYLPKPFTPKELMRQIREMFQGTDPQA